MLLGCIQVLVDKMKQDNDWVAISTAYDPHLLLKIMEKFERKQLDKQCKMEVLIAEQQSTSQLRLDEQVSKTTYYNQYTTRVEVAFQAGVCYHSPDLLQDNTTQLKMGSHKSLLTTNKK